MQYNGSFQSNNCNSGNPMMEALNQNYIRQIAGQYNETQNLQRTVYQVEDATRKLKDFLDSYDQAFAMWPDGMTASLITVLMDYINKHRRY